MGESDDVPLRVSRYFLTPCEKWEHGRRPFKLVTQIFKILIITTQIYRFGSLTQGKFNFFKYLINKKLIRHGRIPKRRRAGGEEYTDRWEQCRVHQQPGRVLPRDL